MAQVLHGFINQLSSLACSLCVLREMRALGTQALDSSGSTNGCINGRFGGAFGVSGSGMENGMRMSETMRDCQLVVMGSFGRVDLAHVIGFERRRATEPPNGWEGMFDLERGSSAADDFIARIEAAYNDGGAVPASTLYQYVSETDGSTSTYQYDCAVFRLGPAKPRQRVEFHASHRRRI